jgi:hypothetical protein
MAGKDKKPKEQSSSIPMGGGGGSVGSVGSASQTDRISQIKDLQATSPFANVSSNVRVDSTKDFDLNKEAFNFRSSVLKKMSGKVKDLFNKSKFKNFNQHVKNVTYTEDGFEKQKHEFYGKVNTKLYSPKKVMDIQGGVYVDGNKFKPPQKGSVE